MEHLIPQKELERLGDLLTYLIIQRERGKPVLYLHQTIRDLKLLIQRIIVNYYTPLKMDEEYQFVNDISDYLCQIHAEITEEGFDEVFCAYSINEIISSFKRADSIKYGLPETPSHNTLHSEVPILENFDLKLRPLFRLVKSEAL